MGDARHHVVDALEVLHVHRRQHVHARVQQLFHVLPALGVARARGVGVRQLVHEHEGRGAGQDAVQVELPERDAAVGDLPARQHLEPLQERLRLPPAVGLHHAHHHVHPFGLPLPGGLQHGVRLPHARHRPQEHLEPAAHPGAVVADVGQEGVGVWPARGSRPGRQRVQGQVQPEHVHTRLTPEGHEGPLRVLGHEGAERRLGDSPGRGHPGHLIERARRRDVGVEAAPGGGEEVHGDGPVAVPARRASARACRRAASSGLRGPRLEPWEAAPLYGYPGVAEGRLQNQPGASKGCPMRAEPTTVPSTERRLPFAWSGNSAWATPVIASG